MVPTGTVDLSSEICLDYTSKCAEERRGLKMVSKLCVLRGDKSLEYQIVPFLPYSIEHVPATQTTFNNLQAQWLIRVPMW